ALGSEIRGISFDQQLRKRHSFRHFPQSLTLFEGDNPAEREVPAARKHLLCFLYRSCKAVQNSRRSLFIFLVGDSEKIGKGFAAMKDDRQITLECKMEVPL